MIVVECRVERCHNGFIVSVLRDAPPQERTAMSRTSMSSFSLRAEERHIFPTLSEVTAFLEKVYG